ncbi:CCD63 protein, partial [Bucorvus abyssinicus]|nr:CCD63 protein [Bucorvus abyssinicus]
KEIKSLTQEHEELSQIASPRNAGMDVGKCAEVQCLLQTKSRYNSLIRERKALLDDLENQIVELEKKLVRQDQRTAKVKRVNSSKRLQKRVETLELHLSDVSKHLAALWRPQEVKNLQIQKAILDDSYLKLHKKLGQQRKRMKTATEQSTQAYKQRMEALTRSSDLDKRHNKDTVQHNLEMQMQEYGLDHETKLKSFITAKCTDRSELEEQAKRQKALKAAERAQQNQGESFESRKVAHMRLQELAGDRDIDQLVHDFLKREHESFSCFSYITKLTNEIGMMQQRINDLQSEITPIMMEKERAESKKLHVLKELEEKLTETTMEANWYEDTCKKSSKVLGQLKSDIETLFKELGCDATEIMKQLGEKGQITERNRTWRSLMEKKTTELPLMESLRRYPSDDDSEPAQPFESPLLGSTKLLRVMDPAQLCPSPPALDSTDDAIDAVEVPLDHDQLRRLILQCHQKDQGNAAEVEQQ